MSGLPSHSNDVITKFNLPQSAISSTFSMQTFKSLKHDCKLVPFSPCCQSTLESLLTGYTDKCHLTYRVRKYTKFGVFYAKIVQMTPLRLRRESLRLQKFSVTNREPLRLQKFSVTNTVLSLPFSQQIQFTLIVNVVNLN